MYSQKGKVEASLIVHIYVYSMSLIMAAPVPFRSLSGRELFGKLDHRGDYASVVGIPRMSKHGHGIR